MPVEHARLTALAEEVGRFHITDRAMLRAQKKFVEMLAAGEPPAHDLAAYLDAVRRYFTGFESEARAHLHDVEKRLAHASQVQFNLTAERGVASRRVTVTQGVLAKIAELGQP